MDSLAKSQIFKEWVNQYYEYGFRIAFKIIGNEEDCRDIVQDAFLKVWIKFETYDNRIKFSTWLFSIISNLCFDRLRKRKTVVNYSAFIAVKKSNNEENTLNNINENQLRNTLSKLSENLSPKQRIVFVLRDMEEMDIEEVCAITNMDAARVKANLYYARKAIRKNLISLKIVEERL
jgi:RNA polymerase sigma-70 factor (ECF subfamily)